MGRASQVVLSCFREWTAELGVSSFLTAARQQLIPCERRDEHGDTLPSCQQPNREIATKQQQAGLLLYKALLNVLEHALRVFG